MLKVFAVVVFGLAAVFSQQPHDYYHVLHLPHNPPLHPVLVTAPRTTFTCEGRSRGYYADVQAGCQVIWDTSGSGPKPAGAVGLFERVTAALVNKGLTKEHGRFLAAGCQAYHFCWRQHLVSTDLCANGTLFNEQFQVCDHFYNVRCGSPYEDL